MGDALFWIGVISTQVSALGLRLRLGCQQNNTKLHRVYGMGFSVVYGLRFRVRVSGANLFAVFSSPQPVRNPSIEGNISECLNAIFLNRASESCQGATATRV